MTVPVMARFGAPTTNTDRGMVRDSRKCRYAIRFLLA
jgi:hypothetical protein